MHVNDAYHGHLGRSVRDPSSREVTARAAGCAALFINYEDLPYDNRHEVALYGSLAIPPAADIIIIRDWYNTLASRLQSIATAERTGNPLRLHAITWERIASAWQEHGNHALSAQTNGRPVKVIHYNDWFSDHEYRVATAQSLGLPNSDSRNGAVPIFGDGSSFDGTSKQGNAGQMNVLRRWVDLAPAERSVFEALAVDESMSILNRRLFGFGADDVFADLQSNAVTS